MGNEQGGHKEEATNFKVAPALGRASRRSVAFSKDGLEFGVDHPCAVNTPVVEEFELQNITSNKLKFSFAPPSEEICQITFTPEKGSIAPHKTKKIRVQVFMKKSANVNFKVPITIGVEKNFLSIRVRCETGVFGVDPATLEQVEDNGYRVPKVLAVMRESLVESEGLKCEGIFRVAGDHSEVNRLKQQMNAKTFKGAADPPSVANLVKVWFRELPTPVLNALPSETLFYSTTAEQCVEAYMKLPEPQKTILDWLMDLLVDTAKYEGINKMSPQNLAIVVAPNLYDSSSSDPMEGLVMSQKCVQFLNQVLKWRCGEPVPGYPTPIRPVNGANGNTAGGATGSSAAAASNTNVKPQDGDGKSKRKSTKVEEGSGKRKSAKIEGEELEKKEKRKSKRKSTNISENEIHV
jgi:hypothetical protein